MTAATPLRTAKLPPPPPVDAAAHPYAAHLLELVENVADRSSWSDELALAAPLWPDAYYCHPARANVLRALDLTGRTTALELGAGAGALTRFLGETVAMVDALEPDPSLAAVAAARCAGLASVQVGTGWIDAVPAGAVYDLIIAIDAMAQIEANGSTLDDFVARCRDLLTADGLLVMAVDNLDGLRFTLGEPAPALPDRSGRRSVLVGGSQISGAVESAGLQHFTLSALPDHRHTQLLLSVPALADLAPRLLSDLPSFTHHPMQQPHADLPAERHLWEASLADGTADGRANSVIALIAARAPAEVVIDVATFWSRGRAAAQSACNRVRREDGAAVVVRTHTYPEAPPVEAPLRLRPHTEQIVEGTSITVLLATETDATRAGELLAAWHRLVDASVAGSDATAPWDLIPRNVMVLADGSLHAIDQEWALEGADAELIRARGAFWLAEDLTRRPTPPPWLGHGTIGRTATRLRLLAGEELDPFWLETFIRQEADDATWVQPLTSRRARAVNVRENRGALMSVSRSGDHQTTNDELDGQMTDSTLRALLAAMTEENDVLRHRLETLELDVRRTALVHRDHSLGLLAETEILRDRLAWVQGDRRKARQRVTDLEKRLKTLKASTTWRIGSFFVRPLARLRGRSAS